MRARTLLLLFLFSLLLDDISLSCVWCARYVTDLTLHGVLRNRHGFFPFLTGAVEFNLLDYLPRSEICARAHSKLDGIVPPWSSCLQIPAFTTRPIELVLQNVRVFLSYLGFQVSVVSPT